MKRRQMKQGGFLGMKGQQPWAGKESWAVICTQVPGRWEVCDSHPYSQLLTPQNSDPQICLESSCTALVQNSSVSPGIQ